MMRHWSLRTRFVLAALACLLPLLGVSVYVLLQGLEHSRNQLIDTEVAVADLVAQNVAETLGDYVGILEDAALTDEVRRLDGVNAGAVLARFVPGRPNLKALFLVDARGALVTSTGNLDLIELKPRFSTALERALLGDQGVSDRLVVPEGDVVAVVAPVWDEDKSEGQPVGAVGLLFSVARLERTLQPVSGADTEIALVSTLGLIAPPGVEPSQDDLTVQLADVIADAVTGGRGTTTFLDADGNERLAVYTPVEFAGAGWAIVVSNPSPTTYAPNRTLLRSALAVLGGAAALTLILAVVLGEVMARPLRHLTTQATALAAGEYEQNVQTVGGGEVRNLSVAFQEMADRLVSQVRDLESAREERERQAEQLRDLHRRTLRLQEDERRRIAGEIHDAVSPLITGALYQARALRLTNGSTEAAARDEALGAIGEHLERATEELHGVIFALRPPDLDDIGVVAAIERFVQGMQRSGLACRLEVLGEATELAPEVRLGVYRIVQEALHNVLRHAGADEAVVRLETTDELLRVTIRDNGAGFDPERAVRPTSLGLLSMRERAAAIGATLEILARPGAGTAIVIERPLGGELVAPSAGDAALAAFGQDHDGRASTTDEYLIIGEREPMETRTKPVNVGRS